MTALNTRQFGDYSVRSISRNSGGAVEAVHNQTGERLGLLGWHAAQPESRSPNNEVTPAKPPTIYSAHVHKDYQRLGVGSAMFQHAQREEPQLQHSMALTPAGQAFARRNPGA